MSKKFFFRVTALGFILVLTLGSVFGSPEKDLNRGKSPNCQKACNEWFKMQHMEAVANLRSCLERAKTEKEKEACKEAYKTTMQEARKTLKEKKRECIACVHNAIARFKEGKRSAKAAFHLCMRTAETREARKVCRGVFKEALKQLKEALRGELKACFEAV